MEAKIRDFIDTLFIAVPDTAESAQTKEKMYGDAVRRYREFLNGGMDEYEAYSKCLPSAAEAEIIISRLKTSENSGAASRTYYYSPDNPAGTAVDEDSYALYKTKAKSRNAVFTAVAVMLFILCPVPCILLQNSAGVALMFLMVAVGVGLLIFEGMTKKKTYSSEYIKTGDGSEPENEAMKAVGAALCLIIAAAYFIISFATSAWYITWVILPLGAALEGLIKAIFDLRKGN